MEAQEDIDEGRQDVARWKRKAHQAQSEMQELKGTIGLLVRIACYVGCSVKKKFNFNKPIFRPIGRPGISKRSHREETEEAGVRHQRHERHQQAGSSGQREGCQGLRTHEEHQKTARGTH